jgi:hypothetical protein
MSKRWSFVESFWEPRRGPLVFFAVAYVFGISVNVASNQIAGRFWTIAFLYVVPALVALFILSPWVIGVVARFWRVAEVDRAVLKSAGRYAGVVAFASAGEGRATVYRAIDYHRPRHAWIFCSERSEAEARQLGAELIRDGIIAAEGLHHRKLSDQEFANPEAVRAAIEAEVYAKLDEHDLSEEEIVIDFTGGKKETTAGALLAGLPPGRHLEVVRPEVVDRNQRGTVAGEVMEIDLRYRLRPVK